MMTEPNITFGNDFEEVESMLSALIEDTKQDPLDPPLCEDLPDAIILEDDNPVR
jgi:hypothetical protein